MFCHAMVVENVLQNVFAPFRRNRKEWNENQKSKKQKNEEKNEMHTMQMKRFDMFENRSKSPRRETPTAII